MDPEMRDGVLDDLNSEITELTELVNELVAVASGELDEQPNEQIELASLGRGGRRTRGPPSLASRARSRSATAESWRPRGPRSSGRSRTSSTMPASSTRADPRSTCVVDAGTLTVLDRGPGIADGEHERIFDRFHRSESARSMPGSGLGLADRARRRDPRRRCGVGQLPRRWRRRDRVHPAAVRAAVPDGDPAPGRAIQG